MILRENSPADQTWRQDRPRVKEVRTEQRECNPYWKALTFASFHHQIMMIKVSQARRNNGQEDRECQVDKAGVLCWTGSGTPCGGYCLDFSVQVLIFK